MLILAIVPDQVVGVQRPLDIDATVPRMVMPVFVAMEEASPRHWAIEAGGVVVDAVDVPRLAHSMARRGGFAVEPGPIFVMVEVVVHMRNEVLAASSVHGPSIAAIAAGAAAPACGVEAAVHVHVVGHVDVEPPAGLARRLDSAGAVRWLGGPLVPPTVVRRRLRPNLLLCFGEAVEQSLVQCKLSQGQLVVRRRRNQRWRRRLVSAGLCLGLPPLGWVAKTDDKILLLRAALAVHQLHLHPRRCATHGKSSCGVNFAAGVAKGSKLNTPDRFLSEAKMPGKAAIGEGDQMQVAFCPLEDAAHCPAQAATAPLKSLSNRSCSTQPLKQGAG